MWLETVVDESLKRHEKASPSDYADAARQFLLRWSFYSSMVIRDLTLRSAASFGSFHLIRLLYDEYMFYLIEHRVAKAVGKVPVAVMLDAGTKDDDRAAKRRKEGPAAEEVAARASKETAPVVVNGKCSVKSVRTRLKNWNRN